MTKVAFIDDSTLMQRFIGKMLEKAGYEMEIWYPISAAEIAPRIKASQPDLILSDYIMPGCSGSTVARMARNASPDLPIIILTSSNDEEIDRILMKFGVTCVLRKPIEHQALIEAIEAAIAKT